MELFLHVLGGPGRPAVHTRFTKFLISHKREEAGAEPSLLLSRLASLRTKETAAAVFLYNVLCNLPW